MSQSEWASTSRPPGLSTRCTSTRWATGSARCSTVFSDTTRSRLAVGSSSPASRSTIRLCTRGSCRRSSSRSETWSTRVHDGGLVGEQLAHRAPLPAAEVGHVQPRLVEPGQLRDPRVPSHGPDPIPEPAARYPRAGGGHDDGRHRRSATRPARGRRGRRRPGGRGAGRRAAAGRSRRRRGQRGVGGLARAGRDDAARRPGARRCPTSSSAPSWCCSPSRTTRWPTSSPAWRPRTAGGRGSWWCTPAAATAPVCWNPLCDKGRSRWRCTRR